MRPSRGSCWVDDSQQVRSKVGEPHLGLVYKDLHDLWWNDVAAGARKWTLEHRGYMAHRRRVYFTVGVCQRASFFTASGPFHSIYTFYFSSFCYSSFTINILLARASIYLTTARTCSSLSAGPAANDS